MAVWLHGFPDHPPTAESFLTLVSRTRHVVAPWLRGYAPSPLTGPFDIRTLAQDTIALIAELDRRLGCGPVDLIGHDWGAVITYAVCALAPERVRRAVAMAVPHPLSMVRALASPVQLARSWYMGLFQLPGAERLVRANDLALIDRLWRAWSPGFALDEARRDELHACLAASLPAPLAYYRALPRNLGISRRLGRGPLAPPILQLHGGRDGCIAPRDFADDRRFVRRERAVVANAGHFLHLEQPAAIAARVTAWLS